ncbi:MAG: glycosyltransferase family protein [Pirellulaceae bacterium]
MNVAMLHYHLNYGGVTQVLASQIRALDRVCTRADGVRVAVLCGGPPQAWPPDLARTLTAVEVTMGMVSRLQYDTHPIDESSLLADQLRAQLLSRGYTPDTTVVHVHNHSLGKNASLPGALRLLAEEGFALLLQIHDFAEDYRPRNYRHLADAWRCDDLFTVLYPQAARVHYAVLNRRDHAVLARAGVPSERLHLLPNPLTTSGPVADRIHARQQLRTRFGIPVTERFLLYPVRAIRRKNLGEALLWSVLGGPSVHVGVTLAPASAAELPIYQRWKQVARDMRLRVYFEMGGAEGLPLDENLASADRVLTTSVTEGFGMAFLESCLAERTLVGRDLPEITGDFAAKGLQLDHLYRQLRIPLEIVGRKAFRDMLQMTYTAVLASYRKRAPVAQELASMTAERTQGESVDFADLDESLQEKVLRQVHADPQIRDHLLVLNPKIRRALQTPLKDAEPVIDQNRRVASQEYSLSTSGARLWQIYQKVGASPPDTSLRGPSRGNHILEDFLAPHRFRPLRG